MRTFQIALVILLISLAGYAEAKNPAGCMKVLHDFGALVVSLNPFRTETKNDADSAPAPGNLTDAKGGSVITPAPIATTNEAPTGTPSPAWVPPKPHVIDPDAGHPDLITTLINGKLIVNNGGTFVFPATAPIASIHYFALYYAAAWNAPSQIFTPQLVQWYNDFKPSHPGFELIFVSEDHDVDAQLGYMKDMNMPWPSLRFDQIQHDGNGTFKGSGIEQFAGGVIPDLVLVDPKGNVLLDSFQGDKYVGPEQVMNGIAKVVGP